MKKSNFVALVLGTISGVFFALGMCMALLPEWDAFTQGIVFGSVGIVLGLVTVFVWRKMEKKPSIKLSAKNIVAIIVGVTGVLVFGLGMCLCLLWENFAVGTIVGLAGIVMLISLIPIIKGLE